MSIPHAYLVHFPIALLSICFVFEVAALVTRKSELSRVGWWTQIAGTVGLAAAVYTGLQAREKVSVPPGWSESVQTHEQLAFLTAAVFASLLLWRIATKSAVPKKGGVLFYLLLLAGVGSLLFGAWLGGEMVYRGGIGVAG